MKNLLSILHGVRILHVSNASSASDVSAAFGVVNVFADSNDSASWLGNALREAKNLELQFHEVYGAFEGVKALQSQPFDVVLVSLRPHAALDFISGCRTSGSFLPILILGAVGEPNLWTRCCERDGDGWISLEKSTVSDLLWQIAAAIEHRHGAERTLKLESGLKQAKNAECEENQKYIQEQRKTLQHLCSSVRSPKELCVRYSELLKSFILSASRDFSDEFRSFCEDLYAEKITLAELSMLHLEALESLLQTFEYKNPRRLMHRAHQLLEELSIRLWDLNFGTPGVSDGPFPNFRPDGF